MSKENEPHDFSWEMAIARKIIRDLYGDNTKKYEIMSKKLDECTNEIQIDLVLGWGRRNLL